MKRIRRGSVGVLAVGCLGVVLSACSGQGDGAASASQSSVAGFGSGGGGGLDPLFIGADGGADMPCVACIESSCSTQLSALEGELKAIEQATQAAFKCVEQNKCFSLFWNDHDAGAGSGQSAVEACVAACEADAGVSDRDAAEGELMTLTQALESCVSTSCASSCPGADHDAGGGHLSGNPHDAGVADTDAAGNGNGNGTGNGQGGGNGQGDRDCGTDSTDGGNGHGHGGFGF